MSDVGTYRLDAYEKRADIADARMQYIGRGLIRDETSIHVEGLPGDVPGLVRRQEHHHRGDILPGSLARFKGMAATRRRSMSSMVTPSCWARTRRLSSDSAVRFTPGQTELTLMLCVANCCAAVLVRLITLLHRPRWRCPRSPYRQSRRY
jgi:hypothetical protein